MPIGVNEWRAGIFNKRLLIVKRSYHPRPLIERILDTLGCLGYLYLFVWISVFPVPFAGIVVWSWTYLTPKPSKSLCVTSVLSALDYFATISYNLVLQYILKTSQGYIGRMKIKSLIRILQNIVYVMLFCTFFIDLRLGRRYPLNMLLLLSGDIHMNPGQRISKGLKFFHWNLNSICARDSIKIPLIEAYDAIHKFDVIAISESMLDSNIKNEAISIKGFSPEIFRSDHPSNSKTGGVCLYFRDELPIKRRADLEILQEMIVSEVTISRKKVFVITLYRSPSQNSEQFEAFINNVQQVLSTIRDERPHCVIFTGDFNCRSSQWWADDVESPEGAALDEFLETNGLYQLIDEPTNIRNESLSCIDLIITDQPSMFVDYGVHPSLDVHCQHQIIFGNLSLSLPSPPPYKRTIWHYSKANVQTIKNSITNVNWVNSFNSLSPTEMVDYLTRTLYAIVSFHIPNETIRINDKDPPWLTKSLKTAIKRKHRVYRRYIRRGRKQEDWSLVRNLQFENSKKIAEAKNTFYSKLGNKLSDPHIGVKSYWSILKKLVDKKKFANIPPILENGLFITNLEAKANLFNDYFVEQCSTVVTDSTLPDFRPLCPTLLQNVPVEREKVLKLIRSLDSKKAHGCDDISVSMLKICDTEIVEPLCLIFEKCLETGVYPSSWKRANIIPIHKKNSRQNKGNYRPISLLPIFGKIFEKNYF